MNLEKYLYEYIRDGGRNPSLLKKFIGYLERNSVEVNDYPCVVDDFLDSLAYTGATKRNYRTSCNNFVRYVYRRVGLFLPWEQPKREETSRKSVNVDSNPWSLTRKKLEQARKKQENTKENIGPEKFYARIGVNRINNDKEVRDEEEYNAFLEKYERLCK